MEAEAPGVTGFRCDVASFEEVAETCTAILTQFGHVDVLVNNASVYERKPFHEMSMEDIGEIVDINLKGTMYMTRYLLPGMMDREAGKIIIVNCSAGLPTCTNPGETVYSSTKHSQSGFASALANEVREHGITVTSIHPGEIDTPMQERAGTPEETRSQFLTCADVVESIDYVVRADPKVLVKRLELFRSTVWH